MPAWRPYPLLLLLLTGCATAPIAPVTDANAPRELILAAWSADGQRILGVERTGSRCRLVSRDVAGTAEKTEHLDFCPDSLRVVRGGSLVLAAAGRTVLVPPTGARVAGVVDALDSERILRAEVDELIWPGGERSRAIRARDFRLLPDGKAAIAVVPGLDGERLVRIGSDGTSLTLAGPFQAIDSFDLAPDGLEAVLSARREDNFDVALASTDGGEVNWIGPDPLDETMVSWAPRGSKVTYRIEAPMGSVLRSVHVPTGFQKSFSWPGTLVRSLAWEPAAEKFVVLAESPTWPPHARIADYAGEGWSPLFLEAPDEAGDPEPAAGLRDSWVWTPQGLRYNEKVPLVVWLDEGELWRWSAVRADLQKNLRLGTVVLGRRTGPDWLKTLLAELPWADPARVYIVNASSRAIEAADALDTVVLAPAGFARPEGAARQVELTGPDPERDAAQWLSRELEEAIEE